MPGLTTEQREGIVRHFLSKLGDTLLTEAEQELNRTAPTGDPQITGSVIEAAVSRALAPVVERIAAIERSYAEPMPRRSLTPQPYRGESQPSNQPYRLRTAEELARNGVI